MIVPDPGAAYEQCESYCPVCSMPMPYKRAYAASSSAVAVEANHVDEDMVGDLF